MQRLARTRTRHVLELFKTGPCISVCCATKIIAEGLQTRFRDSQRLDPDPNPDSTANQPLAASTVVVHRGLAGFVYGAEVVDTNLNAMYNMVQWMADVHDLKTFGTSCSMLSGSMALDMQMQTLWPFFCCVVWRCKCL